MRELVRCRCGHIELLHGHTCSRCGALVEEMRCAACRGLFYAGEEPHDAHDEDCDALDGWPCVCDLVVHARCCSTCESEVPGQLDLLDAS